MKQERRHNWKDYISRQAKERHEQKMTLLSDLDVIRQKIRAVGVNFALYDELKQQEREIVAKLATL